MEQQKACTIRKADVKAKWSRVRNLATRIYFSGRYSNRPFGHPCQPSPYSGPPCTGSSEVQREFGGYQRGFEWFVLGKADANIQIFYSGISCDVRESLLCHLLPFTILDSFVLHQCYHKHCSRQSERCFCFCFFFLKIAKYKLPSFHWQLLPQKCKRRNCFHTVSSEFTLTKFWESGFLA